jgi:hypothetical protein
LPTAGPEFKKTKCFVTPLSCLSCI